MSPHPVQMADAERGRPLKKVWFVWSVRDNYMVEAVLPHDHAYERKQLPARLPKSFSPDMINVDLVADPATVQPDHPNKDDMMLHTEFYLTKASPSGHCHTPCSGPLTLALSAFGTFQPSPQLQVATTTAAASLCWPGRLSTLFCSGHAGSCHSCEHFLVNTFETLSWFPASDGVMLLPQTTNQSSLA